MTWNGRVSIHDDLSRLHISDRAGDMSRDIGYSSITAGEGSLDLLTASGSVAARYGDQPDGRFGVSLVHKGVLRFIPDLITDLETEDGSLSDRISGVGDRMVSAESRLDGHDATFATNDGRISGLGDRMVTAEGTLSSHGTRLGNVESKNSSQDSTLSSHNTRINTAQARADDAHADAATAQARADAAYSLAEGRATQTQISNLASSISTLTQKVADIEQWLTNELGYPAPMQ